MIFNMKGFIFRLASGPSPRPSPVEPSPGLSPSRRGIVGRGGNINTTMRGFTLIEAFVAITILMLAIVGPLSIASQSAMLSAFTRDQMTANFLAQDAMEYVRATRDSNLLAGNPWLQGFTTGDCINNTCSIDTSVKPPTIQACSNVDCTDHLLSYDKTTGTYNNGSGVLTTFARAIKITSPAASPDASNGKEVLVTVVVTWTTGSQQHSVTVAEDMMQWSG